jgi:uncharacterized repeat protein (TIGR01451 family)
MSRFLTALLSLAILPLYSFGQAALPSPSRGTSPLLYVRFTAPAAAQVTVYQGTAHEYAAPVLLGLRPGYVYHIKVANFPDRPDLALFPTLEVRGALQLPANLRAADHPVPISLTPTDVEQALAGALITKVFYLEDPAKAVAVATRADQALETEIGTGQDPVAEARNQGRPLLILRLGGRAFLPEELAGLSIGGTILCPGDTALRPPAAAPCLRWECLPLYECLHDGGDAGLQAGFDQNGRLRGVEPADTVAEYRDSQGQKHIAVSNRVCLCVPRFGVIRIHTTPTGYEGVLLVNRTGSSVAGSLLKESLPALVANQNEHLAALRSRQTVSGTENSTAPVNVFLLEGAALASASYGTRTVVGTCVQKTPVPPDRPLLLCKWCDKQSAQIGDIVTFYLRYTNQGGQPMTGVAVEDSLTGRLEYIPGSAKTDREAVFTMKPNEAGSLLLRWEIGGQLPAGQSGVVSFQVRIR